MVENGASDVHVRSGHRPARAVPGAQVGPHGDDALDGLRRVDLFGLRFVDAGGEGAVVSALLSALDRPSVLGGDPVVVTPNTHHLVRLADAPHALEHEVCRRARYVLPDGVPVVVGSRILRRPLTTRLAGSTLFSLLWPELCRTGRRTLLVAPSDAVADRLVARHPRALAHTPPHFTVDDETAMSRLVDACLEAAADLRPEIVVIGLGHPKQERLVAHLLDRWPAELGTPPLFCCLGASLEFEAGLRRRAPVWVQRAGGEWFFRFLQEPRRLFRRYFVEDPRFVRVVWDERRRMRR